MQTRALVLPAAQSPVEVRAVEIPEPGPGEVLVRMEACGICHSDLFLSGLEKLPRSPVILGHEGIGRVVAVGDAPDDLNASDLNAGDLHPGDRVGITFLGSTCGTCEYCRTGRERFCPRQRNLGFTMDGALCGYGLAHSSQVIRIPDDIPAAALAPLCCAGWTAYGALREAALCPGQSVALFGYGGLGQLALQYGRAQGLRVAVADVSQAKLETAMGAGAEFTTRAENGGRTLQKNLGGVDAAIVFTGSVDAISQAIRSVKRTGTIVLVGLTSRDLPLSITDAVLRGIRIRGSFLGTRGDLETVFALGRDQRLLPVVETFALDDAPEILARLDRGDVPSRAIVTFPE